MKFYLFNSLKKNKEEFIPKDKNLVKFYACGPTVYAPIHIGNARSMVIYDVLYRILRYLYGAKNVIFVRNITDIDDKIIAKSLQERISPQELAIKNINIFKQDMKFLNCLEPNFQPRVSNTIQLIIQLIQQLLKSGHAYSKEGNIYFKISKFQDYFSLSGRNLNEHNTHMRVSIDINKQHTEDFVLWKHSQDNEIGFNSPFGFGRPGWHIECSAMIYKFLGTNVDLHAGGRDLIFPHHSNEIAQSKSLFPESNFVNYWVHSGLLTINGQKMSKSLNNILTIDQIKDKGLSAEVLRVFFLNTHYSKDLDYNEKSINDIQNLLSYWKNAFRNIDLTKIRDFRSKISQDFLKSILSNLNTHNALVIINEKIKKMNKMSEGESKMLIASEIFASMKFLSIEKIFYNDSFQVEKRHVEEIEKLIQLRTKLRIEKNWTKADEIKNQLLKNYKIQIEDLNEKYTKWYYL